MARRRWATGLAALSVLGAASCGSTVTGPGGGGAAGSGYGACQESSECVVRPESCCGSCGAASRGDVVAINSTQSDAYLAAVCDDLGCPACYREPDPSLLATCEAGQCTVVDLFEQSLTDCQAPSDCKLRAQACCECGADTSRTGLIAIRADAEAEYAALVCDAEQTCNYCAPTYPADAMAICTPDGTCMASWIGPPE